MKRMSCFSLNDNGEVCAFCNECMDNAPKDDEKAPVVMVEETKPRQIGKRDVLSNDDLLVLQDLTEDTRALFDKYIRYKIRAAKKGLVFVFDYHDFYELTCCNCFYCGTTDAGGVDRVENDIGYTIENSVPCCSMCNMMKHRHSESTFLNHVAKIYAYRRRMVLEDWCENGDKKANE